MYGVCIFIFSSFYPNLDERYHLSYKDGKILEEESDDDGDGIAGENDDEGENDGDNGIVIFFIVTRTEPFINIVSNSGVELSLDCLE